MVTARRSITCIAAGTALVLLCLGNAACNGLHVTSSPGTTKDQGSVSATTTSQLPSPGTETTKAAQNEPTAIPTAIPTQVTPTPGPTLAPTPTDARTGYSALLAEYLADPEHGDKVGARALRLNGGDWHNACVYVASEALRQVGCAIPQQTNYTPVLMQQLADRGFSKHTDLSALQPGDICFTTDEKGRSDGIPTHTFIFLGWAGESEMNIFDNQIYDYDSLYHPRPVGLSYYMNDPDRPKEATAFFMRSPP